MPGTNFRIRRGRNRVLALDRTTGGIMDANEITVVARIVARADQVDGMRKLLTSLEAPTRAEAGCLGYAFFQDAERPTHFISIERWASAAAVAAHMETPHVRSAFAAAGPLLAEPPEIRSYRPI